MNGGIRWTNGEESRLHSPAMVKPIDIGRLDGHGSFPGKFPPFKPNF